MPKYEKIVEDAGLDRWFLPELLAKLATHSTKDGKGIFFLGVTGCGKTRRLKLIADVFSVPIRDAQELVNDLRRCDEQDHFIDSINLPRFGLTNKRNRYDFIIDDLGVEAKEVLTYGTRRDIMEEVLYERYKIFPDYRTHFSSNLTLEAIRQSYGERIFSRLNEMCVFITLPGEDRRMANKDGGF